MNPYLLTFDGAVTIHNAAGQPIAASQIGWHQSYGSMYHDEETDLYYSVYRYYSPALGRFLTSDPAGIWFDLGGMGNGYAWAGNRYIDSRDPLGLKEECCKKKPYVLLIAASKASTSIFYGFSNRNYWNIVNRVRAALKKKKYEVREWVWDIEKKDDKKYKKSKMKVLSTMFRAAISDPCFKGFVFFGHGGALNNKKGKRARYNGKLAVMTSWWSSGTFSKLDHKLDFCLLWACGSAADEGWERHVEDPGDVVAAEGDLKTGAFASSGDDHADRMVGAIKESPGG